MKDRLKALDKKTIVAIAATCILIVIAIIGAVAFLKDDGSSSASDEIAQRESEVINETGSENKTDGNGSDANENNSNANTNSTDSSNETTNNVVDGTNAGTTTANANVTRNGTTTATTNANVPNQEYVTERVEETERQITEDLMVSWQKLDLSGKFTNINIDESNVIAEKFSSQDEKTVVAGDEITYTIEVKNISKEAKKGIKVSDVVPAQTELVGVGELESGDTAVVKEIDGVKKIYWSIDFAEGVEAKTLSFTVRVLEDATGTIRNVAVVNGGKTNETHNTIIDTIKTSEIVKCDREEFEGTTVHENDEIKYTLTIKNTGDIAEKVSVSDTIKEGLTFKEGSLEADISDVPVKFENGEVSLEDYELAANATLKISFVATVNPLGENEDGSPITKGKIDANKVTVNSKETTDKTPDGGDKDYDVVKPYVVTNKASKVVKCDDYGMIDGDGVDKVKTVHEADEIEYTITVSNEEGKASDLVSLRDEIPEGLSFVAGSLNAEAVRAGVDVTDNVLTLDDYTIEAGAVLNITFKVSVNELGKDEAGNDRTSAKLEANKVIVNDDKENPKEDPDPPTDVKKPNISATKAFEVSRCTEYKQTGKVNVVHENDEIKYTITVSNTGAEKGTVNLTDTIKSGLSFVSVTTTRGTVQQVTDADGKVTGIKVENYELAAGDELVITLVVKVDVLNDENDLVKVEDNKYVYKKVIDANVATVNEKDIPEDGGDKEVQKPWIEATKTSVVSNCTEPEGLKQTGNVSTVHEGDTISYTITVSNEKGSASKVINVDDEIPAGLTLDEGSVRVSKEVKNMTVSGNKISISDYTLEAGEKLIITFNVTVDKLSNDDYVEDENGNKTCKKLLAPNIAVVDTIEAKDPNPPTEVKKAVIETTKASKIFDCTQTPKQLTGSTVHEGDTIRYTITVSNAKGSEAGIINLSDTIPVGLRISGNVTANLADAQAKIQVSGKTITLTGYKLQAGATLVITFDTAVENLGTTTNEKGETVKATSATINANVVDVNGTTTPDPDGPKEVKKADLNITKTSSLEEGQYAEIGKSFSYYIVVDNNGDEKGSAVVEDEVPANLKIESCGDALTGDTISVEGNKITWNVNDLPARSSRIIEIVVTPKSINGNEQTITNTAKIKNGPESSTEVTVAKPVISTNKASQIIDCTQTPEVLTGSTVHEGDRIKYTITIKNDGYVAGDITVNDPIPDGMTYKAETLNSEAVTAGVFVENNTVKLNGYSLAAKTTLTITFEVTIDELEGTTIVDGKEVPVTSATINANVVDVNGTTTPDPDGPKEVKKADLNITKTSSIEKGQYAEIGKSFSYYIVVDNNGDEKGSAVVEDEVPANLKIESCGDALTGDTISVEGNKITWNVNDLPARSSRIIEIVVTPKSISGNEQTITNTAKIKDGPESSTDVTIAKPVISTTKASMVVSCNDYGMVDKPGAKVEDKVKTVHEGDEIEYTITVTNSGKVAGDVSLTDTLKSGVSYVNGSVGAELVTVAADGSETKTILSNVASYDSATNTVSANYSLVAGGKLVVKFKVSVNEITGTNTDGTPITEADFVKNEVYVNGGKTEDPDGPTKVKKPYITATKTTPAASAGYLRNGEVVVYTITVTNKGDATGSATVTDVIDARLDYKTAALVNKYKDDTFEYNDDTRTFTWNVVDLPAGDSRTATITVWVGKFNNVSDTIPNAVLVDGEETDKVEITVGKPVISTTKTSKITDCTKNPKVLTGTTVHEGDEIEYTITISNTGAVSKVINVEDQIKDGLIYVDDTLTASLENTGAVITNGKLVISNYELAGGAKLTITFKVRVDELDENDYSVDETGNTVYKKVIDRNAVVVDEKTTTDDTDYEVIKPMINTTKDVSTGLVKAGEEFYYTLRVENKGTDSGSVTVTDEIPEGLTYNGFEKVDLLLSADEISESNGVLTWEVKSLAPDTVREIRVYVTANALAEDGDDRITIRNTVKQDGTLTDFEDVDVARPVISTTKASAIIDCTQTPKVLTGSIVHEGDKIKYTITIENKGDVAGDITVDDPIPGGMTYKAETLNTTVVNNDGKNVETVINNANVVNNVVKLNGSLGAHEKLTITFEVTIDNLGKDENKNNITSAKLDANTVKVNSVPTTDPEPPTEVNKADIVIVKTSTVTDSHVNVDGEFEYVIKATNRGKAAGSAVVTDIIPSDFKYTGYTQVDGDVVDDANDPEIKWYINNLAADASRELRIKVVAKNIDGVEKKVTNTATIDNGNPPSSTDVTIGKAKLSTTKASMVVSCNDYGMVDGTGVTKVKTVHEGDVIEYTITVTNSGKVAGAVSLADTLKTGVKYVDDSVSAELVTVAADGSETKTTLNDVASYDSATNTVSADYLLAAGGKLVVTFKVSVSELGTNKDGTPITEADFVKNEVYVNGGKTEDSDGPEKIKKPLINTTKSSVISECAKGLTTGTTVHEGDKIRYTITVLNSGDEYKVINNISDTLKAGVSLTDSEIVIKDNGSVVQNVTASVSEDRRTISLGGYRLEAGHTLTIEFEVSVDTLGNNPDGSPITEGEIKANKVTVDSKETTDKTPDGGDKDYDVVKPNINVTKQVLNTEGNDINGKTVDVRSTLKYVLVGTNTGSEDAEVTITDNIDTTKLTDVEVTGVIRANGTETTTAVTYEDGLVSWSGKLEKNSGNQVIITITAKTRILSESETSYTVENTAHYTPEGSTVPKDTNTVSNDVKIMIESDKTAKVIGSDNGEAEYGDIIEYTITAENKSDSAGKVEINDPLPDDVEFEAGSIRVNGAINENASYDETTRTVSYSGTLAAGAKLALTFKVKAIETEIDKDIVNTATINGVEKSATVDVVKKISITATAEVTNSMDLVLVLDVSGSMDDYGRIEALRAAATALVNKVFPDGVETDTTVTIITYSASSENNGTYTCENKQAALNVISGLTNPNGGTNIKAALDETNTVLTDGSLANDKQVVIFLTDGAPTVPTNDNTNLVNTTNKAWYGNKIDGSDGIISAANELNQNADMVYSIGLGTEKLSSGYCSYVLECSELSVNVITSSSSVDTNNNKVTITLSNSSSRDVTVTDLTVNISGITGVNSNDVTYNNRRGTLTWNNDIVVPANGEISLEVDITRNRNNTVRVNYITPEYQRICTNAEHQAMNSVVPFDGVKTSGGRTYHYYSDNSLAKFVLKTIGKTKYIPVADGANAATTAENLSKEFDNILKDSSTTNSSAVTSTSPTTLTIAETANVIGDVVLSIGDVSYTISIDDLMNGPVTLGEDILSYKQGEGFTLEVKSTDTFMKELKIKYTVDKK